MHAYLWNIIFCQHSINLVFEEPLIKLKKISTKFEKYSLYSSPLLFLIFLFLVNFTTIFYSECNGRYLNIGIWQLIWCVDMAFLLFTQLTCYKQILLCEFENFEWMHSTVVFLRLLILIAFFSFLFFSFLSLMFLSLLKKRIINLVRTKWMYAFCIGK